MSRTINNIPVDFKNPNTLNDGIIDGHEIANSPEDKLLRWGPTFLAEKEASWSSPVGANSVVGPGNPNNPAGLG